MLKSDPALRSTVPYGTGVCSICGQKTVPGEPCPTCGELRRQADLDATLLDGRYVIERRLGGGAMGVVYLANEVILRRPVAIKMILPVLAADADFVRRFVQEARAQARIHHPNVVQVYTLGRQQDSFYLVMEYVGGASLHDILEEHRNRGERMSLPNALTILNSIVRAVSAIHDAGLLHCDLKPANVLIEQDTGRPVVIDFGGAVQSASAIPAIAGSPAYMPPEQHPGSGTPLTRASDIYALGATAYELLTGELPFRAETARDLMQLHREGTLPLVSKKVEELAPFDNLILKAMAKVPRDRFASCRALRAALRAAERQVSPGLHGRMSTRSGSVEELRVLIVEDDEVFAKIATRAAEVAFSKVPVSVRRVASGPEALAVAGSWMPKLITLDYYMPGLDGVATLSAMRTLPGGRDARVVVISASVEEVRWRFAALGVSDYLAKPVMPTALVGTIREIAERSGWLDQLQWPEAIPKA